MVLLADNQPDAISEQVGCLVADCVLAVRSNLE